MARPPRSSANPSDDARMAMEAVQAGDLRMAFEYFAKAVNGDKRNASHRYNFALCAEQIGEIEAAVREHGNALHLNRNHRDSARRLSSLLRRFQLNDWSVLDEQGLAAAFRALQVDTQPLATAALHWLRSQTQFGALLKEGAETGYEAVARRILARPDAILGHELLGSALALGINKLPDVEALLTAVRRVLLLEAGPERLADRTLHTLALCLAEHGLASGYIWISQADEDAAAARIIDLAAVKAGDIEAAHGLLLRAMYRPLATICQGQLSAGACQAVKPRAFRDLIVQHLSQAEAEHKIAAGLPRLGTATEDATSMAVAGHYGALPYPRWTNVEPTPPGAARRSLQRFFSAERLAFMDGPFDVLVAGCGTAHQPVDMALSFGSNARVLGVDLSRPSLAYGQRIANVHGIKNVELAEADILSLPQTGRTFDMIVCTGVLHHMADPFVGWKALNQCLKPAGLQLIALYSETARRDLAQLRAEPGYPGPRCTSAQARAWRQTLMGRKAGEPGGRLTLSHDFYSLPEFRDLVLHPSEQHLTIPRIEAFVNDNGLIFRGFLANMETLSAYAAAYPDETWPGTFASWSDLEHKHPTLFEGMYQFWCEKAA